MKGQSALGLIARRHKAPRERNRKGCEVGFFDLATLISAACVGDGEKRVVGSCGCYYGDGNGSNNDDDDGRVYWMGVLGELIKNGEAN